MASAIGKCKICGEQLNYEPDDVTAFGRHLIEKHNEQITHFQFLGDGGVSVQGCECGCGCGCNCDNRRLDAVSKKAYKATVETWKQGIVSQECPNCGKLGLPLIRKQRNKAR
ncbi:lipopolysaccharide-induced tumor necrosis factor-alpha factor [Holotrichia oblita]|uniref:Lipopolysaccharide-induced tumor necrosis factor-alpha factor n=1 Tax=Holotrichia oblita TaxID=644536 RepID=A0ACB9TW22_HOLOL|nr:lipopolysaccharide-induced tumor necrosis factor-alpha factor [Holotrichia oblita]